MSKFSTTTNEIESLNLEDAKYELLHTEKRVTMLKHHISILEEEKEKKRIKSIDSKLPLALQGETLRHQIMSFLGPYDISRSLQVCREWCRDLDDAHLWEETARNMMPALLQEIKDLEGSSSFNYKGIAQAFAGNHWRRSFSKGTISKSKLLPKHLYLLIEVKDWRTDQVIGTYYENLSNADMYNGLCRIILDRKEERNWIPILFGEMKDLEEYLVFTCRFLRCDTGQYFCFASESPCLERLGGGSQLYFYFDLKVPDADNEAGLQARSLMCLSPYDQLGVQLYIDIEPTTDERTQQAKYYLANNCFCKVWASIEELNDGKSYFRKMSDLLVILGGYEWR